MFFYKIKTEFELKADVDLVKKVFSKFDTNSDGHIEAKELKTAMKELLGKDVTDEEIAEMVNININKYSDYKLKRNIHNNLTKLLE